MVLLPAQGAKLCTLVIHSVSGAWPCGLMSFIWDGDICVTTGPDLVFVVCCSKANSETMRMAKQPTGAPSVLLFVVVPPIGACPPP